MLRAGFVLQNNNIYVFEEHVKDYKEHNVVHTEPAQTVWSRLRISRKHISLLGVKVFLPSQLLRLPKHTPTAWIY
jgi:tmRNA-binding protein